MAVRASTLVFVLALASGIACGSRSGGGEQTSSTHEDLFTKCANCHMADYQSARNHVDQRPTMCPVCHTQEDWHPRETLDHPWQLTGAHETTAKNTEKKCFKCHNATPAVFKGTSKECVGCHRTDYDNAEYHATLPLNCEKCHNTGAWKPALWIDEAAWEPDPEPTEEADASAPDAASSSAPAASSSAPKIVVIIPTAKPSTTTAPTTTPTGSVNVITHASRHR
jgi:hypothetical protein